MADQNAWKQGQQDANRQFGGANTSTWSAPARQSYDAAFNLTNQQNKK